jgi:tetratricopeptide (TPR) repeat protein
VTASDPQVAAAAAVNLANLLAEQREFAEAERLMRQAEITYPPYADRARFNLGCLWAVQGRHQEAEAAFHGVIAGGDPDEAPGAMTHLAALYFRTGRFEESERLYRQVLASGYPEFPALAEAGLADIRRRGGL